MKGNLYLIPVSLGENKLNNILPEKNFKIINEITHYIVENIRSARRFLVKAGIKHKIDDLTFYEINKHSKPDEYHKYLSAALNGENIGVISEAGCPGIADPGADIVAIAHQKNIRIIPLVGPSSIFLALMASGMNGQNFAFKGYLPIKKPQRIKQLKADELRSANENQTQIYIEAPYRNKPLLEDMLNNLKPSTKLCIAADVTLKSEFIKTKSIKDWKKSIPEINKKPAIFVLHSEK
ncbi:MAG: SAM-dependent methyltransferase [Bacteroidales bacterium]|nr:SAM-dependent methyltransferase [Bacteroidales bacterium]